MVFMTEFVRGLKCRLCGKAYPKQPLNYCEDDFGSLEVDYDYDAIREVLNRGKIELRPFNMWRYRELLPIDGEPTVGPLVGGTPLVRADRLAEALGVRRLWVKNDAVNFPTLSFKDRVVSVALSKAVELGFKTVGFEMAEQLGSRTPQHAVCPMAGGSLIGKIQKAFQELAKLGLIDDPSCKIHGAQAAGCNPISAAVKDGLENHRPVRKPNTIAKSLAIGDPADGYFAARVIRGSGGWAEDVTDDEIVDAMLLLGRTEGIFAETAGGVTVAVARKLIEQGRIARDEEIVLCITGNGLKTQEAVSGAVEKLVVIKPSLEDFEPLVEKTPEPALV